MSYAQRQWQQGEARNDKPCPDCGHRIGAHRGLDPVECIEDPSCECGRNFRLVVRERS